jgi:hypothetical protein
MLRKLFFSLIAGTTILIALSQPIHAAPTGATDRSRSTARVIASTKADDYSSWFIEDAASAWTESERKRVELVLANTLTALETLGPDGPALLDGYRFRRFAGEYARDREGKIALVDHTAQEVILADTALLQANTFFIYHELGHIVDHRTERDLDGQFHRLTLETEDATTLHEWTTVQGFFLRGQAHIKHTEATADAFALWIWVEFAGEAIPHFHDTPENADPAAILEVFRDTLSEVFAQ